jgi:hypothetical protein
MSKEGEVGQESHKALSQDHACSRSLFIDDADDCAVRHKMITKFADNKKSLRTVETDEDSQELQSTLDKLCDWLESEV